VFYLHIASQDTDDSGVNYQFILSPLADTPTSDPVSSFDVSQDEALDTATKYIDENYKERSGYSLFWLN